MDGHADFTQKLRSVEDFMSDKSLRKAFQAHCLTSMSDKDAFTHYNTVHIDWKWEFLRKALSKLVPLIRTLSDTFDTAKICKVA